MNLSGTFHPKIFFLKAIVCGVSKIQPLPTLSESLYILLLPSLVCGLCLFFSIHLFILDYILLNTCIVFFLLHLLLFIFLFLMTSPGYLNSSRAFAIWILFNLILHLSSYRYFDFLSSCIFV